MPAPLARLTCCVLIACSLSLLVAPRAWAGDPIPCESLGAAAFSNYQDLEAQGVEAFKANDFPTAIKRFETAKALCAESQSLMFALGRAYHLANQCSPAIDHYKKALLLKGPKLESISKRLTEAETECAKLPGTLAVVCEQPNISLSINGAPPTPCPLTQPMPAGVAVVRAESTNHTPITLDANIQPNQTTSLRIPSLTPLSVAPPNLPDPPPIDIPVTPPPQNPYETTGYYVLSGGALAVLGGLGMYFWADSMRQDVLDAKASVDANNVVQSGLTRQEALALESDANTISGVAWGLLGVGVVAWGVGAVLLFLPPEQPSQPQTLSISPSVSSEHFGLTLGGHF